MNHPTVSIVILNYNGLADTIVCLESLKEITYPSYNVIVVDNASAGNDADVLAQKFGENITVIKNDNNYGYTGGNNIGIKYALEHFDPDYLLLLNNDTKVAPTFLDEMIKAGECDKKIGLVGPKTYLFDDPKRLQLVWTNLNIYRYQISMAGAHELDSGQYDYNRAVDYIQGSCLLIKRKALQCIGMLDEKYFCYWDDSDYCLRARQAGFDICYAYMAKVWHKETYIDKKTAPFRRYYSIRSYLNFRKKYLNRTKYFSFLILFFTIQVWMVAFYIIFCRDLKELQALYRGIRDGL